MARGPVLHRRPRILVLLLSLLLLILSLLLCLFSVSCHNLSYSCGLRQFQIFLKGGGEEGNLSVLSPFIESANNDI